MDGLAKRMAPQMPELAIPQDGGVGTQPYQPSQLTVNDVAAMIMAGEEPDDLLEDGIPMGMIQAAMDMIMRQMAPSPEQSGLASSSLNEQY